MFKTKLFRLLNAAEFINVNGYELEPGEAKGGTWEFSCGDKQTWLFADQEVEVDDDYGQAEKVNCLYRFEGEGFTKERVDMTFENRCPITEEDVK